MTSTARRTHEGTLFCPAVKCPQSAERSISEFHTQLRFIGSLPDLVVNAMPPDMYVLQCKGMLWRFDLNPSRFRQMNGRISATRLTLPLRKLVVLLTISVLPRSWSMPVSLSRRGPRSRLSPAVRCPVLTVPITLCVCVLGIVVPSGSLRSVSHYALDSANRFVIIGDATSFL